MTVIITVVNGTFVPADGNVDRLQSGVVAEGPITQFLNGVGHGNRLERGALGKAISTKLGNGIGEGHTLQRGTGRKGAVADDGKILSKAYVIQCSTAGEGTGLDNRQRIGQDHRSQCGVVLEGIFIDPIHRIAFDNGRNDQVRIIAGIAGDLDEITGGSCIGKVGGRGFCGRNAAAICCHGGQNSRGTFDGYTDPLLRKGVIRTVETDHIRHAAFRFNEIPRACGVGRALCHRRGLLHTVDAYRNSGDACAAFRQNLAAKPLEIIVQFAGTKGNIMFVGISFGIGAGIAVNGQHSTVVHRAVRDRSGVSVDPEHLQSRAAVERSIVNGRQTLRQDHSAQSRRILEGVSGKFDLSLGQLQTGQGTAALKNGTVIVTIVDGTAVPAGGKGHRLQTDTVLEGAIADGCHVVCHGDRLQSRTALKGVSANGGQFMRQCKCGQTGTATQRVFSQEGNPVGECQFLEGNTVLQSLIPDGSQSGGQRQAGKRNAAIEGIGRKLGDALMQINLLQLITALEGKNRKLGQSFGNGDLGQ